MKTPSTSHFWTDASLAASVTSSAVPTSQQDMTCLQFNYTGSPVGNLKIQASLDYAQDQFGNITNSGNWFDLYLSVNGASPAVDMALGSLTSPLGVDISLISFPYIRAVYTRTSGSGTINGYAAKKRIGD